MWGLETSSGCGFSRFYLLSFRVNYLQMTGTYAVALDFFIRFIGDQGIQTATGMVCGRSRASCRVWSPRN